MEEILKAGATLNTKKVDMNNPEIKLLFDNLKVRQEALRQQKNRPFMNLTITI